MPVAPQPFRAQTMHILPEYHVFHRCQGSPMAPHDAFKILNEVEKAIRLEVVQLQFA